MNYTNFRKKLKQYDDLEVLSNELKEELIVITQTLESANKSINFLKVNSFIIDTKLEGYICDLKVKLSKKESSYKKSIKLLNSLNAELNVFNFRNVVFCLSKEINLTLEELAEKLGM